MRYYTKKQKIFSWSVISTGVGIWLWFGPLMRLDYSSGREPNWGVMFSPAQVTYLGLDWRPTYLALLDDLRVRNFRLAANWNSVEPADQQFRWDDTDWQLNEAAERNAVVTLTIGWRTPRWPECHTPEWAKSLTVPQQQEQILELLRAEVEHFQQFAVVTRWQVENEPLLNFFGECPSGDADFLRREVELVKSLDATRPILITDSGELSTWQPAAKIGDQFGTTMYRVVWNRWLGYWHYRVPAAFYNWRAKLLANGVSRTIISELQAEPWAPQGLLALPESEIAKSLSLEQFRGNIAYARKTGLPEVYLWGSEWWQWERLKGNSAYWETARGLFSGQ